MSRAAPIWRRLALGRATPNRAAHRRLDAEWLAAAWEGGQVLVVDERSRVLVDGPPEAPRLVWLPGPKAPDGERLLLAEVDDVPYFAVLVSAPEWPDRDKNGVDVRPAYLREVGAQLEPLESALLTEAVGLANWHREYRYGPRTGAELGWQAAGWEAVTADRTEIVYPRTNPAIIVLVHDNVPGDAGRCLLTRGANWGPGRYSCVAGFVEPGEAAEAAVLREVAEETGVVVDEVSYLASQAWPLPASLMLGFFGVADSSQPVIVETAELEDARWFSRGQLLGRGPAQAPITPSPLSIAHELVTAWRDERL